MSLQRHQRVRMPWRRSTSMPPRSGRSTRKAAPATSPPERRISCRRFRRPAGSDQVVDDQDALPRRDRVVVDLDGVDPVFERVLLPDGLPRQLAFLSDGDEPAAEPVGDGAAEDEAARLDAGHGVDLIPPIRCRQALDRRLEALGIAHEGGYVPEQDPLLGVVRNGAYKSPQIAQRLPPAKLRAQNSNIAGCTVESFIGQQVCEKAAAAAAPGKG